MIKFSLSKLSDTKDRPSTLVVFVHAKDKNFKAIDVPKEITGIVNGFKDEHISAGDLKKGLLFRNANVAGHQHLLFVSRVEAKDIDDREALRRSAAYALTAIKSNKLFSVGFHVPSFGIKGKDLPGALAAVVEGVNLAGYEFKEFKSAPKEKSPELEEIILLVDGKTNVATAKKGIEQGTIMSETINFVRTLGDTPGNLMTPKILAETTVKAAKGTKLKVTVWDKEKIKKEKMGGLYAVSLGSAAEPRFIVMEYNGAGKGKKPVAFVGKGLTFDSGGISIKPSAHMEEMKYDMCGGAAVIGTMLAIARLGLKVNAIGLVPATENMPGPLANKPGDIITARNGKTVEVDNTDAEGRLILMDALVYASEQKPAAIFDTATLTGAIVVALGNSYTGVFTRDRKLMRTIEEAAFDAGEAVWPMPLNDDHVSDMKGTYADLNNISSFKGAGSSTAAAFLEQFVEKGIPWAHFDIAGTAWATGNRLPYCPRKGASGVIVRTFVELAQKHY